MLRSQYFIPTMKETPADAELSSHRLMVRAGMIRKLASGLYTWLPLGLRVLRKVEAVVRDEMNKAGALEVSMPMVQPAELWQESSRWEKYGKELLRLQDRHERDFCLGPTHEEVVTDLVRGELKSYKQLPLCLYQIQTKFRDEIRPRFGLMRAREFTMKDAYSFHETHASLEQTYETIRAAYVNIFTRLGLCFRVVDADTGSIGGNRSEEFHVLADSGEDTLVFCAESEYAANLEKAVSFQDDARPAAEAAMEKFHTPGLRTIQALADEADVPAHQSVKTLLVKGIESPLVALVLRGDHELNELKAARLPEVLAPLEFAEEETIKSVIGCAPGSIGPVGLSIPVIVDHAAAQLADFVCGANEDDYHLKGVNWERDLPLPRCVDLRFVTEGELSPDQAGALQFTRGIEVGHIFQLGQNYSEAMKANVLNEHGKSVILQMGCYGIGVSRVVAASIEQNHDDRGMIWPAAMAPFQVVLVPMSMHKSYRVREVAEKLYADLTAAGIEVLFDDRKERPGVMFSDADLLGIPYRVVIGERGLDNGVVEYKARTDTDPEMVPLEGIVVILQEKIR